MIDDSDPRLPMLNEILADFITKNLRMIPSKTLMFVDVICLLLSPLTIVITLLRDLYIFLPLLLSGLFLSINFELVTTTNAIVIVVLLIGVFSKKLQTDVSRTIFHVFNILTCGYLILTCLVFSSQLHVETLAPLVDLFFHSDMNSMGVL